MKETNYRKLSKKERAMCMAFYWCTIAGDNGCLVAKIALPLLRISLSKSAINVAECMLKGKL